MTVVDRARRYVEKLPAAVSGCRGHDALFRAARVLAHGFALPDEHTWPLLLEYNARCLPPWNDRELRHKLTQAHSVPHRKARGHLAGGAVPGANRDPLWNSAQPPRILGRISLPASLVSGSSDPGKVPGGTTG